MFLIYSRVLLIVIIHHHQYNITPDDLYTKYIRYIHITYLLYYLLHTCYYMNDISEIKINNSNKKKWLYNIQLYINSVY